MAEKKIKQIACNLQTIVTPDLLVIVQDVDRRREYCIIREMLCYDMLKSGESIASIARTIDKDRPSVYNAIRRYDDDYATNPAFRLICDALQGCI